MLLNEAVGYGGALLFPTLKDITGASSAQIIRAWLCALQTIEADRLLQEISQLNSPVARYHAWIHVTKPIFSLLNVWLFSGELPNEKKQKTIRKILAKLPKMAGTTQQDRLNKSIDSLKTRDVPEQLATQIAVLENILFAHEISKSLNDERSINKAIVSYFSIGEASYFLPTIRLLESRRSSGGWDPAANAILRGRFLYLQTKLTQSIDLGPEAKLGIDRVTLRLNRYNLSKLHLDMQKILEDSSDLSALIVANARAQALIQSSFSTEKPIKGTGSIS